MLTHDQKCLLGMFMLHVNFHGAQETIGISILETNCKWAMYGAHTNLVDA